MVETPLSNGTSGTRSRKATITAQILPERPAVQNNQDADARLEALAQERAALREEVIQLRQSLEEIQGKHQEELRTVNDQLDEVQGEKEHIETQYQSLRGKVGQIQSNLKERLRADAVCLDYPSQVFPLIATRKNSPKREVRLKTWKSGTAIFRPRMAPGRLNLQSSRRKEKNGPRSFRVFVTA